jgi:hypothetical protein
VSSHAALRNELSHYAGCNKSGCAPCDQLKSKLATSAADVILDLLLELDQVRSDLKVADNDASEARVELANAMDGDDGEQALANWALDYGAELAVLQASPRTYEVARRALWNRGGPACAAFEVSGALDLCKCGRPFREHRRELATA